MLLSILIPMYNAEHFIERCLNSLLHQDLNINTYEIIVMDDGSRDGSSALVSKFIIDNPQIKLFSEKNCGADATRNKMLKIAQGDFIYFVDADDYVCHNVLGKLVTYAQNKDLDLLAFKALVTNNSNELVTDDDFSALHNSEVMTGAQFLVNNPEHRTEIWWYIINAQFLKNNNIVFEKSKGNGDTIFTLKVFLNAKKIVYYPITVYRYFLSPDSIMRSRDKEKKLKLIESLFLMLTDFTKLVNDIEDKAISSSSLAFDHVKKRQGNSVLFFIHQLLMAKPGTKIFSDYIRKLKKLEMYPVETYLIPEKNGVKERLLYQIIANQYLLFPTSLLYKILK